MKKEIKTLLVQPFYEDWSHKLPLGLAYLAAYLEREKKFVRILDLCAERKSGAEIIRYIDDNGINLIGITSTTPQINFAWRLAEFVKKHNPNIRVILGGTHPSALPEESVEKPSVDFVAVDEGELTLSELVSALENGSGFDSIDGLVYKNGQGEVVRNKPRKLIEDLDSLPFPARHLLPFPEKYKSPGQYHKFFADVLTSRGCPFSCMFCANKVIFGRTYRPRSPENILEEITLLNKKYGLKEVHMADDNFAFNKERALKLCQMMIESGLKMKWACNNGLHATTVNEEVANAMSKAGCYRAAVGIESGNPEIIRKIGKQVSLEQVRNAIRILRRNKIITVGFFMLGNVHENEKTMWDTINFAKRSGLDYAQFCILIPFPGTPAFRYLKENNYLLTEDWKNYRDFNRQVFSTPQITADLLLKMYRHAYQGFYLRPSYFARSAYRILTNVSEFRVGLKGLPQVLARAFRRG